MNEWINYLRCERFTIFATFLNNQWREETGASIQFTLPPTIIHCMYHFSQHPDHFTLSEREFLWTRCLVVIQSKTVAFQACAPTTYILYVHYRGSNVCHKILHMSTSCVCSSVHREQLICDWMKFEKLNTETFLSTVKDGQSTTISYNSTKS